MLWLVALSPPGFGTFVGEPAERTSRTSYSGTIGAGSGINAACSDYDKWSSAKLPGGCSRYSDFISCAGKEEDASSEGIKAKDACCGCGGGITAGKCEAIGYKQDDGLGKACEASGYEQEGLAAQLFQLKEQASRNTWLLQTQIAEQQQTNALLTQLASTLLTQAAQRNLRELVIAKAAGRSAADLKAGFSLTELNQAGFSAAELKEAGFSLDAIKKEKAVVLATKAELEKAIKDWDGTSGIEDWDVSLVDDFSYVVSFATPARVAVLRPQLPARCDAWACAARAHAPSGRTPPARLTRSPPRSDRPRPWK